MLANKVKQLIIILGLVATIFFLPQSVQAQDRSYVYDSIDVQLDVNKDSSVVVTEKITQRFDGVFRGVFREITLSDSVALGKCRVNPSLQCGGFSFMELLGVYDNNNQLISPNKYTTETITKSGEQRLKITWVFSDSGKDFDNELFSYTIKYKVYGSLGYFTDYDMLYWDAIFPDREVIVENASVRITFPEDISYNQDNLRIPDRGYNYTASYNDANNQLIIETQRISPFEDFTVMLRFPKGIIDEYATLQLDINPKPDFITINGTTLNEPSSEVSGIIPGQTNVLIGASGYQDFETSFPLQASETKLITASLQPSLATILFFASLVICNLLGLILLPLILLLIYREYRTKGRDVGRSPVVVPEYSPPDKIRPYLLGSLKDESVDTVDISSTIIDVAYRGYIKIREFDSVSILGIKITAREYEFLKLKDFTDLTPVEQKILTAIFDGKDRVTTSDLKNRFYSKIPGINDAIYAEMVNRTYFPKRPDKVRSKYRTIGITMAVFGSILASVLVFLPFAVTTAFTLVITGIVLIVVSGSMPAKTKLGSKIFDKVLGFKMYMETAERFRVQDLTPETFEKYLPYAMVFGIENQWAERFKDIYTEAPEWFEASSQERMLNTIYLVNSLSNFSRVTNTSLTSTPASSSSGSGWSGGGWSGGGGFSGGFSGGGGGGGGGGAF